MPLIGKGRALSKLRKVARRLDNQISEMRDELEDFEIELEVMEQIVNKTTTGKSKLLKVARRLEAKIEEMRDQLENFEIELEVMEQIIDKTSGKAEKRKRKRAKNQKKPVREIVEEFEDDAEEVEETYTQPQEKVVVKIDADNSSTFRSSRKF